MADPNNNRVLSWNAVPTANGTAANVVLGQPGMTTAVANNGGLSARSLSAPGFVYTSGGKLFAKMGSPITVPTDGRRRVWQAKDQGFLLGLDLAQRAAKRSGRATLRKASSK